MKRHRFITLGSVLAMVLSLATVGYLIWFAFWHQPTDHGKSVKILESEPVQIFFNASQKVALIALMADRCVLCGKRHSFWTKSDCRGGTLRHAAPIGKVIYDSYLLSMTQTGGIRTIQLIVDDWLMIPLLAAYPALYFLVVGIRRFRRHPGHCLHCDYDLTGNESGVCPECGNPDTSPVYKEGRVNQDSYTDIERS